MEPRREEPRKAPPPSVKPKSKRFRIVRLEDRIAPSSGGNTKNCYRGSAHCGTVPCGY